MAVREIRFENMFKLQVDSKSISDSEKFGYLLELVKAKVRERLANEGIEAEYLCGQSYEDSKRS